MGVVSGEDYGQPDGLRDGGRGESLASTQGILFSRFQVNNINSG